MLLAKKHLHVGDTESPSTTEGTCYWGRRLVFILPPSSQSGVNVAVGVSPAVLICNLNATYSTLIFVNDESFFLGLFHCEIMLKYVELTEQWTVQFLRLQGVKIMKNNDFNRMKLDSILEIHVNYDT